MTHAHLLCNDGITGRLWLAALLDAGVAVEAVEGHVAAMDLGANLRVQPDTVRSVVGTRVHIEVAGGAPRLETATSLMQAIDAAGLPARADGRARAVVSAVIRAEAAVHGVAEEAVRLHELANPRTVAVVVAGCAALEALDVATITVGPIAIGDGAVTIAHGRFPVPPPAVLALLEGFVVEGGGRDGELTTPSGAAVLAALAAPAPTLPLLHLRAHGRGVAGEAGDERLLTVLVGAPATDPPGGSGAPSAHASV